MTENNPVHISEKIKVAKHSGFCFGVREAIKKTEDLLGVNGEIYTCGPLIHNRTVTDDLCNRGLRIVDKLSDVKEGSVLVIRSHGESEGFHEEAQKMGLKIIDATCPYVSKIHRLVKKAQEEGRNVVVIGDANHPEVKGIVGWTGGNAKVINSLEEAQALKLDKITLVAQTTITGALWDSIADYLEKSTADLVALRTICSATDQRQRSCAELAANSDIMIVIGDRNSANSRKLYEIAHKNCKNTFFVENKGDLPLKEIQLCDRIGVAAGASTPERIIKEVISTMSEAITENKEVLVEEAVEEVETEEVQAEEIAGTAEEAVEEVVEEVVEEAVEEVAEEVAEEKVAVEEVVEEEVKPTNPMENFMDEIDKQMILPNRGETVEGEIVHVSDREIVVNLGCKKDGIIPKEELVLEDDKELTELFKAGDTIQAKVIKTDDGEGNILLSKKKLVINEHWDEIAEALEGKTVVNAKVVREVKGGVIAVYKEVSGFIPMSQLADRYVEKADEFIGKTLPVKVSKVDQRKNKAVFSHKAYLLEEKQKRVQEIWEALTVGDIVEGTVMRFTDYGAFVDIGGIDGLLHISEISWGKLKHPQEVLTIGDTIDVKILSMNSEKGKISLGYKQTQPEPWQVIDEKYKVEQVIDGTVVQIKEYGAFVELEPGLDGLVHISEIAHKRVTNIQDELSVGQKVKAKILEIDKDRRRISLSIKETIEPSIMEKEEPAVVEVAEEPVIVEEPGEEKPAEEAVSEEPAEEEATTEEAKKEEIAEEAAEDPTDETKEEEPAEEEAVTEEETAAEQ